MNPERAAAQISFYANFSSDAKTQLMQWARLPDDGLINGLLSVAEQFPLFRPLADQAVARPDWIKAVARELRPKPVRGL